MVRGYLHNWLDDFDVSSTSDSYRVRYESTAVLIGCEERAEYTSVKVTAVVLTEIGENAPLGFLAVLNPDVPSESSATTPIDKRSPSSTS